MERIETKRLILRRFEASDGDGLYEYLSDENVVKYEPYEVFTREECIQAAIKRSENSAFWAVCLKETGKLIGNLYFMQQEPYDFMTWELGYVFNANYQGKGYATEGCTVIMNYAFDHLGARRIIAMCNPDNASSWRLLERLKLRREGHLLQTGYFKFDPQGNPLWHDTFEYGILVEEWKAMKA